MPGRIKAKQGCPLQVFALAPQQPSQACQITRLEVRLLRLAGEFFRNLGGVPAHGVKGNAKPLVDAAVDQPVGEEEQEADRNQRKSQKRGDHFGFKAGTKLVLLALNQKLQQNTHQDERKDHKGDEDKGRNSGQQEGLEGVAGMNEAEIERRLAPSQQKQNRNQNKQEDQKRAMRLLRFLIHIATSCRRGFEPAFLLGSDEQFISMRGER